MIPCNECHNCSSIWSPGTEEHDWQQCSSCGWRPGMPVDEDDDDEDWDGYFDDEDDDTDDPNDSRNL